MSRKYIYRRLTSGHDTAKGAPPLWRLLRFRLRRITQKRGDASSPHPFSVLFDEPFAVKLFKRQHTSSTSVQQSLISL